MRLALLPVIVACLMMAGCFAIPKAQKGGGATVYQAAEKSLKSEINGQGEASNPHMPPSATISQPENPNSTSKQAVDYEFEEVVEIPVDTMRETSTTYPDGRIVTIKEPQPAGTKVIKRSKSKVNQELGGSWKDTARQMAAELGSFAAVQYCGIAVLLFGAASFFHPVLRRVVGGKDVALGAGCVGAIMMFGPFFLVKYANFFFLAILLLVGYWVVARLKYKEGRLDLLEEDNQP